MPVVLLGCISAGVAQGRNTCGDPSDGPVLGGVDLVGTFHNDTAAPLMGTPAFIDDSLGGYKFYFASQANLDAFKANTTKYVPLYGGY